MPKPYLTDILYKFPGEVIKCFHDFVRTHQQHAEDVHFVKITSRGTITFSAGKPQEVRALLNAVVEHGYKPAKSLLKACE